MGRRRTCTRLDPVTVVSTLPARVGIVTQLKFHCLNLPAWAVVALSYVIIASTLPLAAAGLIQIRLRDAWVTSTAEFPFVNRSGRL
jgi:hypothetical protein